MNQNLDSSDRRRLYVETRDELKLKARRNCLDLPTQKLGYHQVENEKRARREIANCNERRRMLSINAGFENLRVLLPPVQDGEKLSKAAILQLTAKFINTLLIRVSALEHEVSVYRQSSALTNTTVLPDIADNVTFTRKRQSSEDTDYDACSKNGKRRVENDTTFLDFDDANTSGRSSECCDNHFVCSPTESTIKTAARLEHLVMAIEQIEGGASVGVCEKSDLLENDFQYDSHNSSLYYKFQDSVTTDLKPYVYNLENSDVTNLKCTVNPFTEEFMLRSSPSELSTSLEQENVCDDKPSQSISIDDYLPVVKLLNRPIPHKYLHRPQVVVNNSR